MYGAISTTPSSAAASPTSAARTISRRARRLAPLTALCGELAERAEQQQQRLCEPGRRRLARLDEQSPPPSASPPRLAIPADARVRQPRAAHAAAEVSPLRRRPPRWRPHAAADGHHHHAAASTAARARASTAEDAATPAPTGNRSSLPPVPAPTVLPTDAPGRSRRPSPATGVDAPTPLSSAPSVAKRTRRATPRARRRRRRHLRGVAARRARRVRARGRRAAGWNDVGWQSIPGGPARAGGERFIIAGKEIHAARAA